MSQRHRSSIVPLAILCIGGLAVWHGNRALAAQLDVTTDVNGVGMLPPDNFKEDMAATGPLSLSDEHAPSTASVTANYLSIIASAATDNGSSVGDDGPNQAIAFGSWTDQLTVSKTGFNGSLGTIEFLFDMSGTLNAFHSGDTSGSALYDVNVSVDFTNYSRLGQYLSNPDSTGFTGDPIAPFAADPLPFTFGTPFDLLVSLSAWAGGDGWPPTGAGSAGGTAQDVHLQYLGFIVRDLNDNIISGVGVASQSGVSYAVPEPSALWLLAIGAVASVGFLQR